MKKSLLSLSSLFAAALCAFAAPVKPEKVLKLEPEAASVKAGEIYRGKLTVECAPGFTIRDWDATIIRKNAPPDFFNKKIPANKIKPYASAHDYDSTTLLAITYLPANSTKAEVNIKLDTTGFAPGDYAINVSADFIGGGKTITKILQLFLNVTGSDARMVKTFQENEPPFRSVKLEKNTMTGAVNKTIAPKVLYDMMPFVTLINYDIVASKKVLPANFPGKAVEGSADMVYIVRNGSVGRARNNSGSLNVLLPLNGLPKGKYSMIIRPRATKSGGSFRGVYTADLPITVEVK